MADEKQEGVRVFFSSGDFTPNVCMRGLSSSSRGRRAFPPLLSNCQADKNKFERLESRAGEAPNGTHLYIYYTQHRTRVERLERCKKLYVFYLKSSAGPGTEIS